MKNGIINVKVKWKKNEYMLNTIKLYYFVNFMSNLLITYIYIYLSTSILKQVKRIINKELSQKQTKNIMIIESMSQYFLNLQE